MNKYFLSLMFILILFQSFKVADEIFTYKDDSSNSYIIIKDMGNSEEFYDTLSSEKPRRKVL